MHKVVLLAVAAVVVVMVVVVTGSCTTEAVYVYLWIKRSLLARCILRGDLKIPASPRNVNMAIDRQTNELLY